MTDRYAVVGHPIAHSKSPFIHAAFARQTGEDIAYERVLAPLDGFVQTVLAFRDAGGRGVNVTLPFKAEACAMATRVAPRARAAGAANTLRFDGAEMFADNTDGPGLVRDLADNLGVPIAGRRVLMLGAGGAARGVLRPLLDCGPAQLVIANRSEARARALVEQSAAGRVLTWSAFAALAGQPFDLVINATSASLAGEALALPDGLFAPGALAYDMMYAVEPTPFMRFATAQGAARVADGIGMLVEQAAESFFLWRGVRPRTAPVIAALR